MCRGACQLPAPSSASQCPQPCAVTGSGWQSNRGTRWQRPGTDLGSRWDELFHSTPCHGEGEVSHMGISPVSWWQGCAGILPWVCMCPRCPPAVLLVLAVTSSRAQMGLGLIFGHSLLLSWQGPSTFLNLLGQKRRLASSWTPWDADPCWGL